MNYMREHGFDAARFSALFQRIAVPDFDEMLLGRLIVVLPPFDNFKNVVKTPLPAVQEQSFSGLYEVFMQSLVSLNAGLGQRFRAISRGEEYFLDATLPDSLPGLRADGGLTFEFSMPVANAIFKLQSFYEDSAKNRTVELDRNIENHLVRIGLPPLEHDAKLLRRVLIVCVWGQDEHRITRFRIVTG
jgi:hypothetical protein